MLSYSNIKIIGIKAKQNQPFTDLNETRFIFTDKYNNGQQVIYFCTIVQTLQMNLSKID